MIQSAVQRLQLGQLITRLSPGVFTELGIIPRSAELADLAGVTIPVRASGPLEDPSFRVDVAALLQARADKEIDEQKAKLEAKLQERLGTKVTLRYRKGKGSVDIKFFNDEDLQRILEMLGVEAD